MNNMITIGTPRIVDHGNGKYRLEADAFWEYEGTQITETVFFEVEEPWAKYLTPEYSDAFVLAVLEIGLETGLDIHFEAPMTEDLKYQLETYLIPVWTKYIPKLKPICLTGPTTTKKVETIGVAGTGFSAGVDSFYSVLKHINSPYQSKCVTHLLLAVNGAAETGISAEIDQKWYKEEMRQFSMLAKEMQRELIGINSNISLLNRYRKLIKGGDVIVTSSFVHALRKLFGTYYWASTYEAQILDFNTKDIGYSEPFLVPLLSVDGLRFYHSGCEVNRTEKVAYIADYDVVQKGLTVCGYTKNCGKCPKCSRTMAELYAVGKMDKFDAVFPDTDTYEKHLGRNLGRELAQDHSPFTTDILRTIKKNGKKIPLSTYLWKWLWFKPMVILRKKLKHNRFVIWLYYEKGWVEKLGEHRAPDDIVNARLAGERAEK